MKLKNSDQQQLWVETQRRCQLSDEAVRIVKELGLIGSDFGTWRSEKGE